VWHLYVEQTLQESGVEKINGFVLSSNKLTHKFVGLVTSDLWLDVARGPPVWPRCLKHRCYAVGVKLIQGHYHVNCTYMDVTEIEYGWTVNLAR